MIHSACLMLIIRTYFGLQDIYSNLSNPKKYVWCITEWVCHRLLVIFNPKILIGIIEKSIIINSIIVYLVLECTDLGSPRTPGC